MKKVSILALHLGYGGIEKCITSLANMLASYYEVEIICVYQLYEEPVFKLDERVSIQYLIHDRKPNKKEFKKALSNKQLLKIIKEGASGIKTLYLRKHKMIEAIKNSHSDIIIATRDIFDEWLSLYGKEDTLKIGWEHNHHHQNEKYAREIVRSCKDLDHLVLVSKDLYKFYQKKMKPYHCRCSYIPNMLDFIPKTSSKLDKERFISVGRLSPEKGFTDLIDLAVNLKKRYASWHLDIIGDGVLKDQLEKEIKEKNLTSFITLHGFQNSDYIAKLLHQSSIYLMTSYTESFGIVLIEAMSHGLPCIAYDSAEGAKEIIQSGYNGYLIKHRNKNAYLKKVDDLVKQEDTRKQLGKNAKKSVHIYMPEEIIKKWQNLLEKEVK